MFNKFKQLERVSKNLIVLNHKCYPQLIHNHQKKKKKKEHDDHSNSIDLGKPFNVTNTTDPDTLLLLNTLHTPLVSIINSTSPHTNDVIFLASPLRIIDNNSTLNTTHLNSFQAHHTILDPLKKQLFLTRPTNLTSVELLQSGLATHIVPQNKFSPLVSILKKIQTSDLSVLSMTIEQHMTPTDHFKWHDFHLDHNIATILEKNTFISDILDSLSRIKNSSQLAKADMIIKQIESRPLINVIKDSFLFEYTKGLDLKSCLEADYKANKVISQLLEKQNQQDLINNGGTSTNSTRINNLTQIKTELEFKSLFETIIIPPYDIFKEPTTRTTNEYIYRTVTGLPDVTDIKKFVLGEIGGGDFARTKTEVVDYFNLNWGGYLSRDTLKPIDFFELENRGGALYATSHLLLDDHHHHHHHHHHQKNYMGDDDDDYDHHLHLHHQKDASLHFRQDSIPEVRGVQARVEYIIDNYCELIDGKYLKWKPEYL